MYLPLISQPRRSLRQRAEGSTGGASSGAKGITGGSGESEGGAGGLSSGHSVGKKLIQWRFSGTSTDGEASKVPLSSSSSMSLGKSSATAYGYGGGDSIVIPDGQPFAGRSAGGGTRGQIFGNRTYGSGYPGITGYGVSGRGFPFWFWPVVWSDTAAESQPYLNGSEYGNASNTSRFGGPLMEATFISNSSSPNTTFHVLSDNSTVTSLIQSIDANCSHYLSSSSSSSPIPFDVSSANAPQPQQAVQYYRASSVVLTLDGYNNSATFSSNANLTDSPLPSNMDMNLSVCLNQTIARAVPLVNGALPSSFVAPPLASVAVLAVVISFLLSSF
ncbi:hypothetical protein PISMIDRAFT_113810 [Pisolithus microcarpus 441]|uniref:Uncharacterized protein n=1 Tax=Pisolithus microcarpus 441 TaxID=765257 RepID=A0A0C9YQX4_9AGAM|nr:hypothetical protein BKA83DRAFT_113810 [Pisolithus microcarpus]KIK16234.1 hypothetical protein PISMIDRAFT_113810 [Pisolithus microcarpus 441]